MMRIKRGDRVFVIAGKDKGKQGVVKEVQPKFSKVVVEGVNFKKFFVKPSPQMEQQGGIESKEFPLHVSNVLFFDVETGKGSKIGFKNLENGQKVRFVKKTGRPLDI